MRGKGRWMRAIVFTMLILSLLHTPLLASGETTVTQDKGAVEKSTSLLDLSKSSIPSAFSASAKTALTSYKAGTLLTPFFSKNSALTNSLLKALSYSELWNLERALSTKGKRFYEPGTTPPPPGVLLTADEQNLLTRVRAEMQQIMNQYTVIAPGQSVDMGDGVLRQLSLTADENDIVTLRLDTLSIRLNGYLNNYVDTVDGNGRPWRLPRLVTVDKKTGAKALLIEQYGDSDANYTNIVSLRHGKLYRVHTVCPISGNRFNGDGTLFASRIATPFYTVAKYAFTPSKLTRLYVRTSPVQVPIEMNLRTLRESGNDALKDIERVKLRILGGGTKEYEDGAQFAVIKIKSNCIALLDAEGKVAMIKSKNGGNDIAGISNLPFIMLFDGFNFMS